MQWIRALDYLFVLRPIVFFPGWTTMLAAYVVSGESVELSATPVYPLGHLLAATGMLMGCGFIVNQLADKESDQINNKLFLISRQMMSPSHAKIEALIMGLGGIVLTGLVSTPLLIITLSSFFLIPAYSLPPFRLMDHAFRSLFANATMGALAFIYGWFIRGSAGMPLVLAMIPYLTYNTAMCLLTTVPDVFGDQQTRKHTIAVKYGTSKTIGSALFLVMVSFSYAVVAGDWLIAVPSIISVLVLVFAAFKNSPPLSMIALKTSLFAFALALSFIFPWYAVLVAIFYLLARVYYFRRFGIHYPNFRGQ